MKENRRGLNDLLEENKININEKEEVIEISLELIKPNPYQPRKVFKEEELKELSLSIKENGVIQPIIVKKIFDGYLLVAGERRCRAAKLAGLTSVPAIIRDYNNIYLAEIALLENIQRVDLTVIEEATAYKNAIDTLHLTHQELADKIGKSRSHVSNILGILNLPLEVRNFVNDGKLSMGHARALSKLKSDERIIELAKTIIKKNLSVREVEKLVDKEEKAHKIKKAEKKYAYVKELDELKKIIIDKTGNNKITIKQNQVTIKVESEEEIEYLKKLFKE